MNVNNMGFKGIIYLWSGLVDGFNLIFRSGKQGKEKTKSILAGIWKIGIATVTICTIGIVLAVFAFIGLLASSMG